MLEFSNLVFAMKPILGTFGACCALTSTPTIAKVMMRGIIPTHFRYFDIAQYRFWIFDFRLSERESQSRIQILLFKVLSPNRKSAIENLKCHLTTLSALARTFGGIVNPICFAALRLIINSNFVGCSTGRSAGLAPLRLL